jgi:hypothetical protein
MIITQKSVGVEIVDVIPMVDSLPRTPAISPDLGNAAVIAASRFVASHQDEIKAGLDADFKESRWPIGAVLKREKRVALDSLDPEDRKPHLATYLRHASQFESRDGLTTKRELRRLPFSLKQVPGLIDFYQSRVDIYETAVASSLNKPYPQQQFPGHNAIFDEATRVVEMVGVTERTGDIFNTALDTSPTLAEYYKYDPRSEVYFLLKHIKTRMKYQGYVEQLLDFSAMPSAEIEPFQEPEESQDIAA